MGGRISRARIAMQYRGIRINMGVNYQNFLRGETMHNYLLKLRLLKISPGVANLEVRHDDWCLIYNGGECNCDPDLYLHPATSAQEFTKKFLELDKESRTAFNSKRN